MVLETVKKDVGLSAAEVRESREKHGKNILPRAKRKSFLSAFVKNLGDPVIKILLCALVVDILLLFRSGDVWETVGIAVSVVSATLISTLSERGSERAFEKLEASSGEGRCRVRRAEGIWNDGKPEKWYYAIPFVLIWLAVIVAVILLLR